METTGGETTGGGCGGGGGELEREAGEDWRGGEQRVGGSIVPNTHCYTGTFD